MWNSNDWCIEKNIQFYLLKNYKLKQQWDTIFWPEYWQNSKGLIASWVGKYVKK